MRKQITGLALSCGCALMPLSAVAQGTSEQRAACAGDAMRLCGQFIPDVDRITSCMINMRRDLSPPVARCSTRREDEVHTQLKQHETACAGAVERSANIQPHKHLNQGEGETAPLRRKEDFSGCPHPTRTLLPSD